MAATPFGEYRIRLTAPLDHTPAFPRLGRNETPGPVPLTPGPNSVVSRAMRSLFAASRRGIHQLLYGIGVAALLVVGGGLWLLQHVSVGSGVFRENLGSHLIGRLF